MALHFLENEDEAGDRSVECRGQTCPRARGDQGTSLTRSGRKPSAHHLSYGGSHLNRRTFPTESQTSTDARNSSHELDPHHSQPAQVSKPVENGFHMRNTAAGSLGSKPPCQADGHGGTESSH